MICPKCGSDNPDDAKFCISCGTVLDDSGYVQSSISRNRLDQACFGFPGGTLLSLIIGAFIIILGILSLFGRNFGEMMGNWGEGFGEMMGNWGEGFGEMMGNWGEGLGRFFAEWGTSWGVRLSASFSIIIGLVIVYYFVYGRGRR